MINDRISQLREIMREKGYSGYIMPLCDPHQSEYPATHWKSMEWISGFTGSAGTVLITLDHAGLWTDSRYYIQAETELATSSMVMHKMDAQRSPGFLNYLGDHLKEGDIVIADAPMISLSQEKKYHEILSDKGIKLHMENDFIGSIWDERPSVPLDPVFEHPIKYAGRSRTDKISEVRKKMAEQGASHHLITTLDDIAWMLNLRGRDVSCNPVFVAYCVIAPSSVYLFINESKIPDELKKTLVDEGITLRPYYGVSDFLSALTDNEKVLIHKATINAQLNSLLNNTTVLDGPLISRHLKAIKNETEIRHFRDVHVKDAIALTHAFFWLEQTVKERGVSEYEFAAKLAECRGEQPHYFGESFNAIVGYKGNGAIIHYRPEMDSCAEIQNDGILLVDSGGQYIDGTTDITRTITFTPPPPEQKNAYTRVLKGHIALAKAVFPEGTTGGQLDALARKSLWEDCLNYGHGTGHGVGFFMNVHEPPQGFAPGATGRASSIQKAGMVTSNEPGHYVQDSYGIRIENLLLTIAAEKEGFLKFETITYFPIDTQLIDFSLLTKDEVQWLNAYHKDVLTRLTPHLDGDLLDWMKNKCLPV